MPSISAWQRLRKWKRNSQSPQRPGQGIGLCPHFIPTEGLGAMTMRYTQTASSEQMTFLGEEHTTRTKQAGVPIYKVTLVREGKMPWGDTRMRNSQMVSALLHQYLEGTDRENLCAVLLNQKNEITGISTISIGSLTSSVAHPREIFKVAILANCAS